MQCCNARHLDVGFQVLLLSVCSDWKAWVPAKCLGKWQVDAMMMLTMLAVRQLLTMMLMACCLSMLFVAMVAVAKLAVQGLAEE